MKKSIKPPPKKTSLLKSGAIISDKNLERGDGWGNILTGLGTGNDKKMAAFLQYQRLSEADVETLYAQDDMAARVVDLLPNHALRKWIKFQGLEEDIELQIQEKLQQLRLKQNVNQLLKWGKLYGGAGMMIGTTDLKSIDKPYVAESVKDVVSFTLMTRYELFPDEIQYDPLAKNFGYPEMYRLALRGDTKINGQEIHHSRIVRCDGVELPRRLHIQNQYWGDSILSRLWQLIRDFSNTHSAVASVMQDFRVGIFKMKNLAEMVAMGQDGAIQRRLALVDAAKSVVRSVVIDAENEDFRQESGQLSGIKDLVEAVNDRFVAATGIPITVLLGRSPVGMGQSGNHEENNWYDMVSAYQEDEVRPILKKLIESVLLSKNSPTGGKIPEGFGFTFNPLWQLDESEKAKMRYTQAQADALYIENGVATPEEIAVSRFGSDEWDGDTNIDLDIRRKLQTASAQNAGQPGAAPQQVDPNTGEDVDPKTILAQAQNAKGIEGSGNSVSSKSGNIATLTASDPRDDAASDQKALHMIVISKEHVSNKSEARKLAGSISSGQSISGMEETGTSYRFKMSDLSEYKPETMISEKAEGFKGVTTISGIRK
jgi:phage-related protein (TIGR01555 family)